MSQLHDYLFDIEAAPDDDRAAQGLCVALLNVRGTGTCGTTTPGEIPCDGPVPGEEDEDGYLPGDGGCSGIVFPGIEVSGQATVGTAADLTLPVPWCQGLGPWWFPGGGEPRLPSLELTGTARILILSASALPPLFILARAAGLAQAALPRPEGLGLTGSRGGAALPANWTLLSASGLDRQADALLRLPVPIVEGHICGLGNPVVRRTPQAAVVGLLGRGSAMLAALAASLTQGLDDPDDMAAALLYVVSNLLEYVGDPESLDFGDRWRCAVGTWFRGQGDCEDGAILLHGMLLACGAASSRLVTIFGRVGPDGLGHAWTCYKRVSDERWTVLDWTAGPRSPLAGPDDLPLLEQSPDYHHVEYALTGERFYQARMRVADFFPSVRADSLALPAPVLAGETNRTARGSLRMGSAALFAGPMTCGALAGSVASGSLPVLAAAVAAGRRAGRARLPLLAALAHGGAWGAAILGLPEPAARCGPRAAGQCRLGFWRGLARGMAAALGHGRCRLPRPRPRGAGCAGSLGRGGAVLPLLAPRTHGVAGTLGDGSVALPAGRGLGSGRMASSGRGEAACGRPCVRARGAADATGGGQRTLEYRREEW